MNRKAIFKLPELSQKIYGHLYISNGNPTRRELYFTNCHWNISSDDTGDIFRKKDWKRYLVNLGLPGVECVA
jgi:hypothetical protein